MKLMIELTEEDYNNIVRLSELEQPMPLVRAAYNAIANGQTSTALFNSIEKEIDQITDIIVTYYPYVSKNEVLDIIDSYKLSNK